MRSDYRGDRRKGEIELVEPRQVLDNGYYCVYDDKVAFPDGTEGSYVRIKGHKNKGVLIVPVTADGEYCLVSIFRHAAAEWLLEFPRGFVEHGEEFEAAARRELREELAAEAGNVRYLGWFYTDTAHMENEMHVFQADVAGSGGAQGATTAGQRLESIRRVACVGEEALQEMVAKSEIKDPYTISAFGKWLAFRAKNGLTGTDGVKTVEKMPAKLNSNVLPLLVAAIDRAAFRSGRSLPEILDAVVAAHPETGYADEAWNGLGEEAREAIIGKARKTLDVFQ